MFDWKTNCSDARRWQPWHDGHKPYLKDVLQNRSSNNTS